jgi:hypothetical protein
MHSHLSRTESIAREIVLFSLCSHHSYTDLDSLPDTVCLLLYTAALNTPERHWRMVIYAERHMLTQSCLSLGRVYVLRKL